MLAIITDYAVPASLFILMLIVGTDLRVDDFRRAIQYPVAVVAATLGQLFLLPLLALLIVALTRLDASLAAAVIVLSLCPGGAISNYYCYLARTNVALSVTITAVTTLASLFTIPLWLVLLRHVGMLFDAPPRVPVAIVFLQLLCLMVVPLGVGMVARRMLPRLGRYQNTLAWLSLLMVALILGSAILVLRNDLAAHAVGVLPAAALFTLGAMLLGWILARGIGTTDEPVLVIECAVRNVAVAVLVGSAQVPEASLGLFFTFLTGYFIAEMLIMLTYAWIVRPTAGTQRVS
jgi:BASS family bile acid:Na+ symporter